MEIAEGKKAVTEIFFAVLANGGFCWEEGEDWRRLTSRALLSYIANQFTKNSSDFAESDASGRLLLVEQSF